MARLNERLGTDWSFDVQRHHCNGGGIEVVAGGKAPFRELIGAADVVELLRAQRHEHRPLARRGLLDSEARPFDDVLHRVAPGQGEAAAGFQALAVHVGVRVVEARAHRRAFEVDHPRRVAPAGEHLVAIGQVDKPVVDFMAAGGGDPVIERRPVWFEEWRETPVIDRERLPAGWRFEGPAIFEEAGGTTVAPLGWTIEVDASGALSVCEYLRARAQGRYTYP